MGALHRSTAARHPTGLTVTPATPARVDIAVGGTLNLALAHQLEDAFHAALDSPAAAILVDLSAVTVIDARAFSTLLRIVDQAYSARLQFRISAAVESLLELAGVKQHLTAESEGLSLAQPRPSRRRPSHLRPAN
jgi:anti-anti-sigma regulatory factor